MSRPWPEISTRLLCLYRYFGNPTECKLTLLSGGRGYGAFVNDAMPFAFNALRSPRHMPEELCRAVFKDFVAYMLRIQAEYFRLLECLELSAGGGYPFATPPKSNVDEHLQQAHRYLCGLDGTAPGDQHFERQVASSKAFLIQADQELLAWLARALEEAHDAWKDLTDFSLHHTSDKVKLLHNPNQSATEIMQYLTHLSRALHLSLSSQPSKAFKEIEAGRRHLVRATLDMRKSIIATALTHRPAIFSRKELTEALNCRVQECTGGVDHPEKTGMYKALAKAALNRFRGPI